MRNKKTNEVTEGVMMFANALINDHHADATDVYLVLSELCRKKALAVINSDPDRNR